jgi:hypothetical protein
MVALGQEVAEPEAHHGADTGTLPRPVGCDMRIDHVSDAHLLDDTKEQGYIVDLFIVEDERRRRLIHHRWYDKAHGTCGNLLIGLVKYSASSAVGCRLTMLPHRA